MVEERPPSEEGCVHGGLVAGVQEQHARAYELILRELLALVDHVDEAGDEVLARGARAAPRQVTEVMGELRARADRVPLGGDRWVQLVHLHDVGGPRSQEVMIRLGDAEHLGDHRHGEGLRERRQHVELARPGDVVDQRRRRSPGRAAGAPRRTAA